jgi:hypothetical protein
VQSARDLKEKSGSGSVLVIVQKSFRAGKGTYGKLGEPAFATTRLEPNSAVHELMHTFNFSDEYDYARDMCRWGYNAKLSREGLTSGCGPNAITTIMRTDVSRCIPKSYWPRIAKVLEVPLPEGADECHLKAPLSLPSVNDPATPYVKYTF